MKTKINIPAGVIAGKLGMGAQMVKWGVQSFTLRRCYRNGYPSGGAVLTMRVNRDHTITGALAKSVRLRKGWTEQTLGFAIYRLMDWVKENEPLWIARIKLEKEVERYNIPEEYPDEHPDAYQDMGMKDIHYWRKYIQENCEPKKQEGNQ